MIQILHFNHDHGRTAIDLSRVVMVNTQGLVTTVSLAPSITLNSTAGSAEAAAEVHRTVVDAWEAWLRDRERRQGVALQK